MVDGSLVYDIQEQANCQLIFKTLKQRFKLVSRAAQLNIWCRLLAFKLDDNYNTVGLATTLKDLLLEWKNANVKINDNTLLSLVVQNSIPPGTKICDEVDRRLENLVQADDRNPPTLSQVLQTIETVRQNQLLADHPHNSRPSVFLAQAGCHDNKTFPPITYPVASYLDAIIP